MSIDSHSPLGISMSLKLLHAQHEMLHAQQCPRYVYRKIARLSRRQGAGGCPHGMFRKQLLWPLHLCCTLECAMLMLLTIS